MIGEVTALQATALLRVRVQVGSMLCSCAPLHRLEAIWSLLHAPVAALMQLHGWLRGMQGSLLGH